jgi:hypothetical protein
VHCYRMLGSLQDAEDLLQDMLLAAWQGFGGFEGRASVRTWLSTGSPPNRCPNARICAMTHFDNGVLPWFGLPLSLPLR